MHGFQKILLYRTPSSYALVTRSSMTPFQDLSVKKAVQLLISSSVSRLLFISGQGVMLQYCSFVFGNYVERDSGSGSLKSFDLCRCMWVLGAKHPYSDDLFSIIARSPASTASQSFKFKNS